MRKNLLTRQIDEFRDHLLWEEKSAKTVEKYLRDIRAFADFAGEQTITKELTVAWKRHLECRGYAVRSVNSMLAALNSFLRCSGREDCRVKTLRVQRQTYCAVEKELSREEYLRLLDASGAHPQLNLVLQTICATGIRVSELCYFTVEALQRGEVCVRCKSKTRTILIPRKLRRKLLDYARERHIISGPVFVTRRGRPLDRSNIWTQMKRLCSRAGVSPGKVFPHNLRKLFARTFYNIEKDIAKLADILGHSSIETTRIYIMTTGIEHRRRIEQLGLVI